MFPARRAQGVGDQGLQLAGGGDGSFSEMRSLGPPGNQMDYFLAQQVLSQCLRAQAGTLPSSPSSRWRCPRSNRLGTPPGGVDYLSSSSLSFLTHQMGMC